MLSQDIAEQILPYEPPRPPGDTGALWPTSLADVLREPAGPPQTTGELQAQYIRSTAETAVRSVENIAASVGDWIQTTGQAVMWIAVLGLGAWALSSFASLRR
jgi:hypothetical protein